VTSPISGVTGRARYSEGSLVTPGNDSSLLTTVNISDPIWVRFSFSESETLQLRQSTGNTVVKLSLPDGSIYEESGKLNFAASTVDTQTGTVALRAEFPNAKLILLPGQFVRVQVVTGEREAYLVPQSALVQSDQGKMLFTVSADNKVTPRPVETAGWSGHDWIVTKGLAAGDKVIVDNLMKLRPGAPVAPHGSGQGPGAQGPGGPTGGTPAGSNGEKGGTGNKTSDAGHNAGNAAGS
jgi:membrane fusion protein (multidrug efflux system)